MDINGNPEINKRKRALEVSRLELKVQELEIKELQLLEDLEVTKNLIKLTEEKIAEIKQQS